MWYVVSIALGAVGVVALGFAGVRLRGPLRSCRQAASIISVETRDQVGLLRARSAGLRVAIAELRRSRTSTPMVETVRSTPK